MKNKVHIVRNANPSKYSPRARNSSGCNQGCGISKGNSFSSGYSEYNSNEDEYYGSGTTTGRGSTRGYGIG